MPRFFNSRIETEHMITGDDASHILKSLRMKSGEHITVCDGKGTDYDCIIEGASDGAVALEIAGKHRTSTEPSTAVTLFQCLTKGDKMDDIVKHSVELGVTEIVPVISEYCVSRPDRKQLQKKIERWQKIAFMAAGQSERGIIPTVRPCISLSECADSLKSYELPLFFYEAGGNDPVKIFDGLKNINTVSIIIGSEGGFSKNEAQLISDSGAVTASLGPRILRAETAPLAALSAVMLLTGNMSR